MKRPITGTTYRELLDSELLHQRFPLLTEATETIGDLQVRNRGSIGSSLAHADPASDMPAVMLALDATFNLRSRRGKRSVKAREFFQGAFTTALAEDELLTDIILPPLPAGASVSYAVAALTGVGEMAYLVKTVDGLVKTEGDDAAMAPAAAGAAAGMDLNGDVYAPAEYRRHLATVITRRALEIALERAQ